MVQIKFCGLTNLADVEAAMQAGCDMIGFNFVPSSSRYIATSRAAELSNRVHGDVRRVGVFADQSSAEIENVISEVNLDLLQFHGDESVDLCRSFQLPFIKSVPSIKLAEYDWIERNYACAYALLIDNQSNDRFGGTGEAFDWNLWPKQSTVKLILAGGLDPTNVAQAISRTHPFAVDTSSGIESAPRQKSSRLMKAFVEAVNCVE